MALRRFEELEVWKHARGLTSQIYYVSNRKQFANDFGLHGQIQGAAVSIMSNIAEGYERDGNQELIQFLSIAKGSCAEVRCQLYVALDQGYIGREEGERLLDSCKKLSIMIHNFMKYLRTSPIKGQKFKKS